MMVERAHPRLVSLVVAFFGTLAVLSAPGSRAADQLVVVRGADGSPEYRDGFDAAVQGWKTLAEQTGARFETVQSKLKLKDWFAPPGEGGETREEGRAGLLWVVFVGHGTFDGRQAKFNLEGEDISADEMKEWVSESDRPLVFINTSASSAPFLPALSREGRVVVTATKDGSEASFTYFGKFFVEAIGSADADIDNDGATSVLEAFIVASRAVKAFFENEGRIASEEALLDDNGDGKGVRARQFKGVVSTVTPEPGGLPDGVRAHQISLVPNPEEAGKSDGWKQERDRLELEVFRLRAKRETMREDAYYKALEEAAERLARHYEDTGEQP